MASTWTSGEVNSPSANDLIVDGGAVPSYGNYQTRVWLNCTIAGTFLIQHRDSTNANTLHEQEASILAGECMQLDTGNVTMAADERIRVLAKSALTLGRVSGSVFVTPA